MEGGKWELEGGDEWLWMRGVEGERGGGDEKAGSRVNVRSIS